MRQPDRRPRRVSGAFETHPVVRALLIRVGMANDTPDIDLLDRIERLVNEEQTLYQRGDLDERETRRLEELRVSLDQYWDLLRQRRALREFGKDPDQAK